ncbi:hypothetical protein AWB74_08632 [Caballeronia arvi]|uniref:Uncharacterized protein n=1 Tax=Caballeronia arvi TaxID=1777135 RepID=A0A158L6S1_9BURK|nr:hypothetical protein [Caballeronia arvi]SAL88580.1 hypothetical protein AWB74_08632 [Caballeronia arvi]
MLAKEGVDSKDVIVRPLTDSGWRIELPRPDGLFVVVVVDQPEALWLAKRIRPEAEIRLMPSDREPI